MSARYTLGIGQRIKREKDIEALFRSGKALSVFPLRLIWLLVPKTDSQFDIQAGFSAPKRRFKRATDRNRIKRLLREQFRVNRHLLEGSIPEGKKLQIFLLFTGPTMPDTPLVKECLEKALTQLKSKIPPESNA
ncbi:MAG: ribonuclease P protein component [Chitinophagaceae bacterium]